MLIVSLPSHQSCPDVHHFLHFLSARCTALSTFSHPDRCLSHLGLKNEAELTDGLHCEGYSFLNGPTNCVVTAFREKFKNRPYSRTVIQQPPCKIKFPTLKTSQDLYCLLLLLFSAYAPFFFTVNCLIKQKWHENSLYQGIYMETPRGTVFP